MIDPDLKQCLDQMFPGIVSVSCADTDGDVVTVWMKGGNQIATISARDGRWAVEPTVGTEMACAENDDDDMIYDDLKDALRTSVLAYRGRSG